MHEINHVLGLQALLRLCSEGYQDRPREYTGSRVFLLQVCTLWKEAKDFGARGCLKWLVAFFGSSLAKVCFAVMYKGCLQGCAKHRVHEHIVVHDACNKSTTHTSCQGIIFIETWGCHFLTDNCLVGC